MLTRNGSCVTATTYSSAGSRGSRRRHAGENGSPAFPFGSATSAAAVVKRRDSLDRLCRDLLALTERGRVLHRTGDHRREQLRAAVADVLELRDADVLYARQAWSLGRAGILDRCGLHRCERDRCECLRRLLVLRDAVRRNTRPRGDRGPAALHLGPGRLEVLRPGRPGDVLPGVAWVG